MKADPRYEIRGGGGCGKRFWSRGVVLHESKLLLVIASNRYSTAENAGLINKN